MGFEQMISIPDCIFNIHLTQRVNYTVGVVGFFNLIAMDSVFTAMGIEKIPSALAKRLGESL